MLIKVNQTLFSYNFISHNSVYCKNHANDNYKHLKIEFISKNEILNSKTNLLSARLEFLLSKLKLTPAELIAFL